MVVPGYIALFMHKPLNVALTIAVAIATYLVVLGLSRVMIVYGKRRTLMMILIGFLLGTVVRLLPFDSIGITRLDGLSAIGFIIPGLIAIWIDRQGLTETLSALFTTAVVVRLVLILCAVELVI